MSAFPANLRAGQSVGVTYQTLGQVEYVRTVDAITKSGRIRVGPWEFNADGSERGAGKQWTRRQLIEMTPALIRSMEDRAIAERLSRFVWGRIPSEKLRRVVAILDEPLPVEGGGK